MWFERFDILQLSAVNLCSSMEDVFQPRFFSPASPSIFSTRSSTVPASRAEEKENKFARKQSAKTRCKKQKAEAGERMQQVLSLLPASRDPSRNKVCYNAGRQQPGTEHTDQRSE